MGIVLENAPQYFYVEGQVALFDELILPNFLHQFVFLEQVSGVFHKDLERRKDLRPQRDGLIVAEENFLFRVETKVPELVNMCGFGRHHPMFPNFSAKAHRKLKTSGRQYLSFREQADGFAGL
jgi:hypothetical protein